MRIASEGILVRLLRLHAPAVAVGVLLGAAVVFLIGVSAVVEGPAPTPPGGGIVTAVTPTHLGVSR